MNITVLATLASAAALAAGIGIAAPASATGTTEVTLVVRGCEGCTVGMVRALSTDGNVKPSRPQFWEGGSAKVSNGRVAFSIPTDITSGVSFTISAPWEGNTGRVSNIILGDGAQGGQRLTATQAKDRRRATACWAGTSAAMVTIRVSVARVKVQGIGGPATAALVWANPSVSTTGPLDSTEKGTLGNQDAYYC